MKHRIIDLHETDKWHAILSRFSHSDVYFFPEYHQLFEKDMAGKALGFVVEAERETLFHSFILRPILHVAGRPVDGSWFDSETVYGYSGPLCTTQDGSFLSRAWDVYEQWCREHEVVAEFARFNPFLQNHRYAGDYFEVLQDRETVVVTTDVGKQELWGSYSSNHRNMVRKAVRKGLTCQLEPTMEGLEEFIPLYRNTMQRLKAEGLYLFPDSHFARLRTLLRERLKIFSVRDGNRIVASAVFLTYGERAHYHLAGSDVQYRSYAVNNLLLHTALLWFAEHRYRWVHLGGGRASSPNDPLFSFKASISRLRLPFHTGRRIHLKEPFEHLCRLWMDRAAITEPRNFFLLYRMEVP